MKVCKIPLKKQVTHALNQYTPIEFPFFRHFPTPFSPSVSPYGDGDIVVGEDEGGVDAGELGVGHGGGVGGARMTSKVKDF